MGILTRGTMNHYGTRHWKIGTVLFLGAIALHGQNVGQRWHRLDSRMGAKAASGLRARANYTIPPPNAAGTFVIFDVPGAVNGTSPSAVSEDGLITGTYGDNVGSGTHSFVRKHDGSFDTFDVPGAVNGTFASTINEGGIVAGIYGDNIGSGYHGFVREHDGTFVTFDVSGSLYLTVNGINSEGAVIGSWYDANFVQHSFVRSREGELLTFDAPSSANGSLPSQITEGGTILGVSDPFGAGYGFARDRSGTFNEVLGPGGLGGQYDLYSLGFGAALSTNDRGEVAGTYFLPISGNPFGGDYEVFIRSKDGEYTAFNAANYSPCCIFSSPSGINATGKVAGFLNDGFGIYRGFFWTREGGVAIFDAPGAGTGVYQGTIPVGITSQDEVVGSFVGPNDGNFFGLHIGHGFIFRP